MRSERDRKLCLRGNGKCTEDTKKEPGREPGQYNGMDYTEKKKKIFKEASPSISNAATSLKTMEAVLLNQYHERHDVVIVRLQ